MKWKDHKRITYYVCKCCGLSEEIAKKVADASVLPDVEPDYILVHGKKRVYWKKVSHHSVEGLKRGLEYLRRARAKYVRDLDYTKDLGKALHYIQDFCVSTQRGFFIFSWKDYGYHEELERGIGSLSINYDTVKKGLEETIFPHQFEGVVLGNGFKKQPTDALNSTVYLSTLAVKLVLNPEVPCDIEEEYSKKLKRHVGFILCGFGVAMLLSLAHGFSLLASSVVGCVVSYITHKLDIPFHRVSFDRSWLLGKFK